MLSAKLGVNNFASKISDSILLCDFSYNLVFIMRETTLSVLAQKNHSKTGNTFNSFSSFCFLFEFCSKKENDLQLYNL